MKRISMRRKEIEIQVFFYEYFLIHIKNLAKGNYIQHDSFQMNKYMYFVYP